MSAPTYKAADAGQIKIPQSARLQMTLPVAAGYSLTGKKVLFLMRVSEAQPAAIFQASSDGAGIVIAGQTISIDISKNTVSEHDEDVTFGGLVAAHKRRDFDFAIDLLPAQENVDTDYRIQGSLYFRAPMGEFAT